MIWLSFVLLIVAWFVLFRTSIGLRLRAVGEHPRAAETVGISVYKTRYVAVVVSGILAALGGAYLSIGFVGSFNEGMTNGRGFIALAAVIFGNWRPFGAYAAAVLFGASTALSFRLATYSDSAAVHLPGAAVRPDAHRRRRRDRPLDPTRRRWPPVREAVTTAPRSRCCSASLAVVAVPVAVVALAADGRRPPASTPSGRSRSPWPAGSPRSSSPAAPAAASAGRSSGRAASAASALGRALGVAGICVALSASIAVGFYELLLRLEG